jgi:hypothetical protein
MIPDQEIWDLEERFWTQGAESARHMTAKDAVFIFPYPAGILQGNTMWREAEVAQRWRSVEMSERVSTRRQDIVALGYRVSAQRGEAPAYEALCSSTYVMDDGEWRRLAHQQTPAD